MKKIFKNVLLMFLFVGCAILSACGEKAKPTSIEVSGVQTSFTIGSQFSIGENAKVTIKMSKGDDLVFDTSSLNYDFDSKVATGNNYSVDFSSYDNQKLGSYTIIVTYLTDTSLKVSYVVEVKEGTLSDGDFSVISYNGNYDGLDHSLLVETSLSNPIITYSTDGQVYSSTNPTFKNAGTYIVYFKVSINGYKDYTSSATITITKATFDMQNVAWNYTEPFTYDGSEKIVELNYLPQGLTAIYSNNKATDAGTYSANVTFSYDTNNYNTIYDFKDCEFVINKATINTSSISWNYTSSFTYDGNEKVVELNYVPEKLTAIYSNNKAINAGSYTASVTFSYDTKNYNIPITPDDCNFTINKMSVEKPSSLNNTYTFSGNENIFGISGFDSNWMTISNNSQTNAGTYTVKVNLRDSANTMWTDSTISELSFEFVINKIYVTKPTLTTNVFTYNSNTQSLYFDNLNTTYINISNDSKKDAGSYIATISLKDKANTAWDDQTHSTDDLTFDYTINKLKFTKPTATVGTNYVYNGTEQIFFMDNFVVGMMDITSNKQTNAGTYNVVVSLGDKANYCWDDNSNNDLDFSFVINKCNISTSSISWDYDASAPFVYDGTEKIVILKNVPVEVTSVSYSNNSQTNVGNYTATATFTYDTNNYTIDNSSLTLNYAISKANPSYTLPTGLTAEKGSLLSSITLPTGFSWSQTYNSTMAVSSTSGVNIYYATYTPSDTANYNVIDNIALNVLVTDSSLSNFASGEIVSSDKTVTYDGLKHNIDVSLSGNAIDGTILYSLENSTTGSGDYTSTLNLIDVGVYKVYYKVSKSNYNDFLGSATLTISKATIDMSSVSWNYTSAFTYDGTEKVVLLTNLPTNVTVTYKDYSNKATNAGNYTAIAVFNFDTNNYNSIDNMTCNFVINKQLIDMSAVSWDYTSAFTYDGSAKSVLLINLPNGISTSYEDNVEIDVGTYHARATFVYDSTNYKLSADVFSVNFTINKAQSRFDGTLSLNSNIFYENQKLSAFEIYSTDSVYYLVGTQKYTVYGSWNFENNSYALVIGQNICNVVFTPNDSNVESYNTTITITAIESNLMSSVVINGNTYEISSNNNTIYAKMPYFEAQDIVFPTRSGYSLYVQVNSNTKSIIQNNTYSMELDQLGYTKLYTFLSYNNNDLTTCIQTIYVNVQLENYINSVTVSTNDEDRPNVILKTNYSETIAKKILAINVNMKSGYTAELYLNSSLVSNDLATYTFNNGMNTLIVATKNSDGKYVCYSNYSFYYSDFRNNFALIDGTSILYSNQINYTDASSIIIAQDSNLESTSTVKIYKDDNLIDFGTITLNNGINRFRFVLSKSGLYSVYKNICYYKTTAGTTLVQSGDVSSFVINNGTKDICSIGNDSASITDSSSMESLSLYTNYSTNNPTKVDGASVILNNDYIVVSFTYKDVAYYKVISAIYNFAKNSDTSFLISYSSGSNNYLLTTSSLTIDLGSSIKIVATNSGCVLSAENSTISYGYIYFINSGSQDLKLNIKSSNGLKSDTTTYALTINPMVVFELIPIVNGVETTSKALKLSISSFTSSGLSTFTGDITLDQVNNTAVAYASLADYEICDASGNTYESGDKYTKVKMVIDAKVLSSVEPKVELNKEQAILKILTDSNNKSYFQFYILSDETNNITIDAKVYLS